MALASRLESATQAGSLWHEENGDWLPPREEKGDFPVRHGSEGRRGPELDNGKRPGTPFARLDFAAPRT